jgi:hypothetical protein
MKIDMYTKAILTVIAICLVWIALGRSVMPAAEAQDRASRVVIVGWEETPTSNVPLAMPLPVRQR